MTAHDTRAPYVSSTDLAAGFDAFYKDTRDRLLLQTFALTGDLGVARSAVREAFVVAWHHWRKTSRLDDPEMSVRPTAWRKALRRSSARPWSRKKDLAPQTRQTLDALAGLTVTQRKALLLTQLAAVTMEEMARELGLPLEAAERELQLGAAQFAMQREVPTSAIPVVLNALGDSIRSATWPRVTIIRRAGAARRRAHTVVGAAAAMVAMVAGGAIATDTSGVRPTLAREAVAEVSAPPPPPPPLTALPQTALLSLRSVQGTLPARGWAEGATTDNSTGSGLVLPCQQSRYADPNGTAAWVRSFRAGPAKKPTRTVLQLSEASLRERAAVRTYRETLSWFTACAERTGSSTTVPQLQLFSTAQVAGLGDRSAVLVLRSTVRKRTYVVGVAGTGLFTTTVVLRADVAPAVANRLGVAQLLADAVTRLCALPDGGRCAPAGRLRVAHRAPYPVGKEPAFLSEIDLPPVNTNRGSWVGTPPVRLKEDRVDSGAIGCETVHLFGRFRGRPIQDNRYRTFLLSKGDLPPEVGLTQTVGSLQRRAAGAFVDRLRDQLAACPDRDQTAGTEVSELAAQTRGTTALSAWRLTTALPGDRSVAYDVAVVRRGTAVSVLVYVAAPRARIADGDFVALARRALERLGQMEPYQP